MEGFSIGFHERLKAAAAELVARRRDEICAGQKRRVYHRSLGYLDGIRELLDEAEAIRLQLSQ